MGGGKLVVKSISYVIITLFFSLSFIINYPIYSAKKNNVKRVASSKRAVTGNTSSTQKTSRRSAGISSKRMGARVKQIKAPSTTQTQEAEVQKLKAEVGAEKQRLAEEKQQLEFERQKIQEAESEAKKIKEETEAEKQKLEEERQKLEAEKQIIEDYKKAEEERLKAEKEEEEEKKRIQEDKEEKERQKQETEEKRLLSLRIKKVEGTEDDYTCIDGWTNYWNESTNPNNKLSKIIVPKIMDSNGVIKDTTVEKKGINKYISIKTPLKNNNNCGGYCDSSINGCYIKATEMLTVQGIKPYNGDLSHNETVFFYNANNEFLDRTMDRTLCRAKMETDDITNDPRTGWTDEENTKWAGNKPVIRLTYTMLVDDYENKIEKAKYNNQTLNKTDAIALYKKIMDYEYKYFFKFKYK